MRPRTGCWPGTPSACSVSEAAVDRSRAFALGDGRTAVPEPDVKAALRRLGVATPAAVAIEVGNVGSSDVTAFAGPLVVKAFGGGIVHKTDVGAVRLGVAPHELPDAMARMSAVLAGHGLAPAGFLVEEQCERAGGVELLAGVVRREPFGLVVALGLGGTLAEAFRQVAVRLFPLSAADARDLIAEIPGARRAHGRPRQDADRSRCARRIPPGARRCGRTRRPAGRRARRAGVQPGAGHR